MHTRTHLQTDDPHHTTPQRSLSHRHRRRYHRHTHTLVCVRVVVAASSEQQQERAQHALLAYAQPTKLTPRAKHDETGSSLGHTAPVWPAPTREIALSSRGAIRGSALWGTYSTARTEVEKKYGPKWQRTAFLGVFFFFRPDPSHYIYFRMVRPV